MNQKNRIRRILSAATITAGVATSLAATSFPAQAEPIPGMRGIQHIGITVPDINEGIAFFKAVFGAVEVFRTGAASPSHAAVSPQPVRRPAAPMAAPASTCSAVARCTSRWWPPARSTRWKTATRRGAATKWDS